MKSILQFVALAAFISVPAYAQQGTAAGDPHQHNATPEAGGSGHQGQAAAPQSGTPQANHDRSAQQGGDKADQHSAAGGQAGHQHQMMMHGQCNGDHAKMHEMKDGCPKSDGPGRHSDHSQPGAKPDK